MRVPPGFIGVLFFFGVLASPAGAAEDFSDGGGVVLSLEDAVERALRHSIELQKSRITLEGEEYSSRRLWAELFPSVNASGGLSLGSVPLFTGTGEDRRIGKENIGYSVSAGLSLNLSAGIPYRMRLLSLAYQRQLLSYEELRRLLEVDTARSFYDLVAEREGLAQLVDTLNLAERQLERHRIGRANGLISEAAVLQSRLAVESARYGLSSAQAAYSNGLGVFLSTLGLSPETPARLEGEFNTRRLDLDPEKLIRDYLPGRPDIAQQRRAIEGLVLTERQAVLGGRAPSLDLSFNWQGGPGGNRALSNPFADNISGSVTLRVPINPWIPGTRESQALRNAGSNVEKARLDLKSLEDAAAAQIRSLTANLHNSWESLEIARLREEIARRSYDYSEQGFLNGSVEALALENSRNNLAEARYQLLRGELAYQKLVLNLAQAINVDWRQFTGGIEHP
ncbi:MAG: TolC family protein [Treponema sp.]|jgi:outer membrane protein TolC|nr:TolC family protein [Treponema sp.]